MTWLSASAALREIYVARRTLLAQRGVDVAGLNALLRYVDGTREGTRIGCFVVHAVDANLVGFFDDRERRLVGWVRVPVDLPPPSGGAVLPEDAAPTDGRARSPTASGSARTARPHGRPACAARGTRAAASRAGSRTRSPRS